MKPKRIVREPEACDRLGCKRTKFRDDYRLNDPANPNVPNTPIPRLRPVPLGPRNIGFLDDELDELITALAELRDTVPAAKRTTRAFIAGQQAQKFQQINVERSSPVAARRTRSDAASNAPINRKNQCK